MPFDLDDPRPSYVQLADALRRAIADGTYAVGDRLPSVRKLAEEHGVANATASKAVEVLQREGLVSSRAGLGTVVREHSAASPAPLQEQVDDLQRRVKALEERAGKD
jgi:GntR family transcriptional regulator